MHQKSPSLPPNTTKSENEKEIKSISKLCTLRLFHLGNICQYSKEIGKTIFNPKALNKKKSMLPLHKS